MAPRGSGAAAASSATTSSSTSALLVRVRSFKEKLDASQLLDLELSPCRRYASLRNVKRELTLFSLLPLPASCGSGGASSSAASSSINTSTNAATSLGSSSGAASSAGSSSASSASTAAVLEGSGEVLPWFQVKNVVHHFWMVAAAPARSTSLYFMQKKKEQQQQQQHQLEGNQYRSRESKQVVLVVLKNNQDVELFYFPVPVSQSKAPVSCLSAHSSSIERAERVSMLSSSSSDSDLLRRPESFEQTVGVQAVFAESNDANDTTSEASSSSASCVVKSFTVPLSMVFNMVDGKLPRTYS